MNMATYDMTTTHAFWRRKKEMVSGRERRDTHTRQVGKPSSAAACSAKQKP